tara:strand:+ start:624 stop:2069 length:1446 start_codon:yes stop_codon:yes gene_type:complete
MINIQKKLIIIFSTFLFLIFLLTIFFKGIEENKSDITNMNILNYIPNDYELTILSNTTNQNIKNYINENISKKKREELNIIKDSFISYLGFDLQEKLEDIYDNELALTFFGNKLNKKDILLIFKLKKNKDLNDVINIGDEVIKSDQILELKRLGKLNYISHIFQTKDNYIIASSNKKLIDSSLQSNNDITKILSVNRMPYDINLKEIKILSISKYINQNNSTSQENKIFNQLITIINCENDKIKLRSFSLYDPRINKEIIETQIDNVKDIIFTNKYSTYKQSINFLYNDIQQKDFVEEIFKEVNEKLLFITNHNNWVLCFKSKLPNKIAIDQFNFLKKYKKEDLSLKNINYTIYTNEKLKIKDNNIIYENDNPIFALEDEIYTYISNDFDDLLNINKNNIQYSKYLNNYSDIIPNKYIFNDMFFIKNIKSKQISKYYKTFKNLQYFLNNELLSLEDIKINISHIIPERNEKVYLESNIKLL